ncbi:MAG: metallophosphoesterase [Deltaproteobacteria bacterium]|nr:metallophosphoesterase [Deltaproteobacteria bacterium]
MILSLLSTAALCGATASLLEAPPLQGARATAQQGDALLANERVAFVLSDPSHPSSFPTGGQLIDAGWLVDPWDQLDGLGVWLEGERAPTYSAIQLDEGDNSATVTLTGEDPAHPGLTVETTYRLGGEDTWLDLTTTVRSDAPSLIPGYALGDTAGWGSCDPWVPGYGEARGATGSQWMGCTGLITSFALGGLAGERLEATHVGAWSRLTGVVADLPPGGELRWSRRLALGGLDVASALRGLPLDPEAGQVELTATLSDGWPASGAQITVYGEQDRPWLLLEADAWGQASASLPAGQWMLVSSAWGQLPQRYPLSLAPGQILSVPLALTPAPDAPPSGDSLSLVQRPLSHIPALVRPGDALPIEVDGEASAWEVSLVRGAHRVPVTVTSTEPGLLRCLTPEVPWWGLYDLEVRADGTADQVSHAVQVVEAFPRSFTFAHITDSHLPTHDFSSYGPWTGDTTEVLDLEEVLADLAILHPDLILHTGDLVNEGELEDYLLGRAHTSALEALRTVDLPVFVVAGNHDLGGWPTTYPPQGTARVTWQRFFGWRDRPTQDYAFDYGPIHFAGLEAWVSYDDLLPEVYGETSFTAAQLAWLRRDLESTDAEGVVLFYHYDFSHQLDLDALGADLALWGHIHSSGGQLDHPPYDLATGATCDNARTYRLIEVVDGVIQPTSPLSAGPGGRTLRVSYEPDNLGGSPQVVARVTNEHRRRFPSARLEIRMPSGGPWELRGGTLLQVDDDGERALLEVQVDLAAGQTTEVVVRGPGAPEEDSAEPTDTGHPTQDQPEPGCGCVSAPAAAPTLLPLALGWRWRRRRGARRGVGPEGTPLQSAR